MTPSQKKTVKQRKEIVKRCANVWKKKKRVKETEGGGVGTPAILDSS